MSMERLSRTSKELGFENHNDMDLEGTMLLSDFDLFLYIFVMLEGPAQIRSLQVVGAHLIANPLYSHPSGIFQQNTPGAPAG